MAQTQIPAGSPLARKVFGAMLFARIVNAPSFANSLTGEGPQQSEAEAKLKAQTAPGLPIVRTTDLSKQRGDVVSVDMFDTITGKPLVGDRNAEGKGEKLVYSSMDIRLDLLSKVVDTGGKMAQQRTIHNLRNLCMAQLQGYFPRLFDQMSIVHMGGARGSMVGRDWILPLENDPDYGDILMNLGVTPGYVKAPTYNRHYVVDSSTTGGLIQGGAQLANIDSTDVFTLDVIDSLSLMLDDMEFPIQPVKLPDDPARDDDPIKAVLFVTPKQWNQIFTQNTGRNWSTFLQNAWERKSYGSKHPLFAGSPGMWNGILVRKLPRYTIRFNPNDTTYIVTSANQYTGAESAQTVNGALTAGYGVERALLLGAQALGCCYGQNQSSGYYFSWHERKYNFERDLEIMGDAMYGMSKLRFNYVDGNGNSVPTDYGVVVIDSAMRI